MAVDDDWRMLPNNVMALLCIVASTGTVPDRAQTAASTVVTGMDSSNFNTFFYRTSRVYQDVSPEEVPLPFRISEWDARTSEADVSSPL